MRFSAFLFASLICFLAYASTVEAFSLRFLKPKSAGTKRGPLTIFRRKETVNLETVNQETIDVFPMNDVQAKGPQYIKMNRSMGRKLQKKYAKIECEEERAFQIVSDLGLLQKAN